MICGIKGVLIIVLSRLSFPASCHSVEVAVGCQDIVQPSVAVQCSIEDDVCSSMYCVFIIFIKC